MRENKLAEKREAGKDVIEDPKSGPVLLSLGFLRPLPWFPYAPLLVALRFLTPETPGEYPTRAEST